MTTCLKIVAFAAFTYAVTGCKPDHVTPTGASATVYLAGSDGNSPAYWKNGVETILPMPDSATAGVGASIVASGSDVYIAGGIVYPHSIHTVVWKNGEITDYGTDSNNLMDFGVSGGDVHLLGYIGSIYDTRPKYGYWINGIRTALPKPDRPVTNLDTTKIIIPVAMSVSGGDVYIGANAKGPVAGANYIFYWKNGEVNYLADAQNPYIQSLSSIYVNNGDVYISGLQGVAAAVWKNGVNLQWPYDPEVQQTINKVTIVGNDVYAAGVITWGTYENPSTRAVLWKNGVRTTLTDFDSQARGIAAANQDIYVIGGGFYLWKNGLLVPPFDGSNHSVILSDIKAY